MNADAELFKALEDGRIPVGFLYLSKRVDGRDRQVPQWQWYEPNASGQGQWHDGSFRECLGHLLHQRK